MLCQYQGNVRKNIVHCTLNTVLAVVGTLKNAVYTIVNMNSIFAGSGGHA